MLKIHFGPINSRLNFQKTTLRSLFKFLRYECGLDKGSLSVKRAAQSGKSASFGKTVFLHHSFYAPITLNGTFLNLFHLLFSKVCPLFIYLFVYYYFAFRFKLLLRSYLNQNTFSNVKGSAVYF
jgi:hypothetical protein